MEEKKLVPKLRFPGFTEPWEQRKLGEEAIEILAGGDIEKEKVVYDSGYPIYANALTNDGLVGYYTDYYRVEAPAVTVTGRGEVGHAQARSQNFTPIVRLLAIRSKHDCYFLENAINNYKTIVESTGVPQLTVPQLSAYKLCFPLNIEEEKRISICFQNLDTLITLHQRKLEHLKLKKKSLLQKLFPKEGEVYPELRFPGFTAPWEQRKFKSLFQKNLERNDGQFPFNKTISISRMIYSESGNGASTESLDNYKVLRVGDIAFEGHENKDFKFGRFVMNDVGNGIMSPRFTVLRPLIDMELNFWKEYINYEPIMQKKLVYSTKKGTMMNELVIEDFLNQYVAVPSVQEQQKIGYLLKCMTDDITLHQRKLEHLQLLKKALLQQLFV